MSKYTIVVGNGTMIERKEDGTFKNCIDGKAVWNRSGTWGGA